VGGSGRSGDENGRSGGGPTSGHVLSS
jgi:hypothetical protein